MRQFIIPLPQLKKQKIIGKTYENIVVKSELNQQMNIILETIGQAIFKRWFVDFDFPLAGTKINTRDGGLPLSGAVILNYSRHPLGPPFGNCHASAPICSRDERLRTLSRVRVRVAGIDFQLSNEFAPHGILRKHS